MSAFRFRLSSLLLLRENVRDECRQKLVDAQRAEDIIHARINALNRVLTDLHGQSEIARRPGAIDVDRLLDADRYKIAVTAQLQAVLNQQIAAMAEVELCRQALVEADREVKTLEKLRQQQAMRHQLNENRRQIKQLDEAAVQRL
jgi:flagellar protein FliJ